MNKQVFYLNVLNSIDNSFSNLKLYVYQIEGPCTYKSLRNIFDRIGLPFDFSEGCVYLTEDSDQVREALEKAGYKISQKRIAQFPDIYDGSNRKILYRMLNKSFENLLHSKGFELSRKHKKRHEKVALPTTNVHKGTSFLATRKIGKIDYVVKEGFEYYFSITEDGTVSLRVEPRPVITIPSSTAEARRHDFTPECTRCDCDNFDDCRIHKLGPVATPIRSDAAPVRICTKDSSFLTMYCHKTKELVAIPPTMLFVEASPYNLRILSIYSKEFYTLNKKPEQRFEMTKKLLRAISDKDGLTLPISKELTLEFQKDFTKIEVEPWK